MKKVEVLREIRETLGSVPKFIEGVPESTIELEWELIKRVELNETMIPNKYKELIGLGVASAIHCQYCIEFHKEAARTFGATNQEIEEAISLAKQTVGWSTYLHGTQADPDRFREDVTKINDYVRSGMATSKVA
ncbi:MAG: hypothetical protein A3D21_05580 [Nitrospirae bacterium RIFCSPHIGHO2_02_FULL_42_12]|nr:MAG: hypothetical protein A3D21_05580 [Nitrospirae bacterium RIFCSPHIGHO2_02_FULL_42_12]